MHDIRQQSHLPETFVYRVCTRPHHAAVTRVSARPGAPARSCGLSQPSRHGASPAGSRGPPSAGPQSAGVPCQSAGGDLSQLASERSAAAPCHAARRCGRGALTRGCLRSASADGRRGGLRSKVASSARRGAVRRGLGCAGATSGEFRSATGRPAGEKGRTWMHKYANRILPNIK